MDQGSTNIITDLADIRISQKNKTTTTGEKYTQAGIKLTFHGILYQIELLLLFLNRGIEHGYNFLLATEMDDADKFDDLVFCYDNEKKDGKVFRFLQAKHKLDGSKKIECKDLLNQDDDDFCIIKYFNSYCKIKNNKKSFDGEIRDVIICTNIDLHEELLNASDKNEIPIVYEINSTDDEIAGYKNYFKAKQYKFLKNSKFYEELKAILKSNHFDKLLESLAKSVSSKEKQLPPSDKLIKEYRTWLFKTVFEKVKNNNGTFIKFIDYIALDQGEGDETLEHFKNKLKEKIVSKEQDILQKTKFKIVESVFDSQKDVINYVTLNLFTDKEIDDFFDKLVLAVNQPNEVELQNIIKQELGSDMNFIYSEFMASRLLKDIVDWAKVKRGYFLTSEHGHILLNSVKQNLARLGLLGLTIANKSKIEEGYTFKDNVQVVQKIKNFLENNDKQVLIIYHKYQLLSSIKILQANANIEVQKYVFCNFDTLCELFETPSCPIEALKSAAYEYNNLIIDNITTLDRANKILRAIFEILMENEKKGKTNKQHENDKIEDDKKEKIQMKEDDNEEKDKIKKKVILNIFYEEMKNANNMLRDLTSKIEYDLQKYVVILVDDDLENEFTYLTSESQQKLLHQSKILFQGKDVCLNSIKDETTYLIHGEILCKLVSGQKLIIGKSFIDDEYKCVEQCFVERTLQRCIIITNDLTCLKNIFFITYDGQVPESVLESRQEIILISENESRFNELCNNYENRTIHWLKQINEYSLTWQQSQGSILRLRSHVEVISVGTDTEAKYRPQQIMTSYERLVIIAAEPGMGKSTLLTHIATQIGAEENSGVIWVVKVNLGKQMKDISDLPKDITLEDAINFIFKAVNNEPFKGKDGGKRAFHEFVSIKINEKTIKFIADNNFKRSDLLEVELFTSFYNGGKVVLLLDGFDKLCPLFKNEALNLIEMIKHTKVMKILVTTRPYNILSEIEKRLDTFAYAITPLNENDQRNILTQLWKSGKLEITDEHTKRFIDDLLRIFSHQINHGNSNNMSEFLSTPLHVAMLATLYVNPFESYLSADSESRFLSLIQNFSLCDLYDNIINKKLGFIYKYHNEEDLPHFNAMEKHRKKTLKNHKVIALLEIFTEEQVRDMIPEVNIECAKSSMPSIKDGKEKTGFIVRNNDGRPEFLHRTFTEYFAADLLARLLNSKDNNSFEKASYVLYDICTSRNSENRVLLNFLNFKLVTYCNNKSHREILTAALNGNWSALDKIENLNDMRDFCSRTPLHLACFNFEWKHYKILLERNTSELSVQDDLFRWTPLHYAVACIGDDDEYDFEMDCSPDSNLLNLVDIKGKTPLMLAVELNRQNMTSILLKCNSDLNRRD